MKKSELIKALSEIEGDDEITFAMEWDIFIDDYGYAFSNNIVKISKEKLYLNSGDDHNHVYDNYDDLFEAINAGSDTEEETIESIKELETRNRIVIKIEVGDI